MPKTNGIEIICRINRVGLVKEKSGEVEESRGFEREVVWHNGGVNRSAGSGLP